jgi:hypothetical protein
MTRLDLLKILIGQARTNGFDFRQWYTACLRLPWVNQQGALDTIDTQRRYYALLFNHDFAQAFWKAGQTITFQIAAQTFERTMPDGSVRVVERKPFMRRTGRPDAWRYHLREMALSEEPLRYMRRYLHVEEEDRVEESLPSQKILPASHPHSQKGNSSRPGLTTLELARKAAERRQREVDALPKGQIIHATNKRSARLPGAR